MHEDLDRRLQVAVDERNRLAALVQKLTGRLESARESLAQVEQECHDKGLDPSTLDAFIRGLESDYAQAVLSLEAQVASAKSSLSPFEDV